MAQAASQPACYGSMLRFPNRSLLLVANSAANSPLSSAAAHWPAQADLASEPCRRRATAIAASAALWVGPQGAGSAELARLRVDTGSARSWRAFPAGGLAGPGTTCSTTRTVRQPTGPAIGSLLPIRGRAWLSTATASAASNLIAISDHKSRGRSATGSLSRRLPADPGTTEWHLLARCCA